MAKLALRRDQLTKFRRIAGDNLKSDAQFAAAIDINPGQLSRILSGKSAPGTKFIVGCLELFGGVDVFADLFAIVDEPEGEAA